MRTSRERRGKRGGAQLEVIIATLLLAIAASAVFGALLAASRQTATATDREQGSLHVERLLDELRDFVTADTAPIPEAPGVPIAGAQTWQLSGDACGCWALTPAPVIHDVTARLPDSLRVGQGATMSYTVTVVTVNGLAVNRVDARLDWNSAP